MENWYLLYCKRGQINRAIENLHHQSVLCITPSIQFEKLINGKREISTEPLFPNYLFVRFNPEKIHTTTIQSTRGVSHFVRFGLYPTTVPDDVISSIQSIPFSKESSKLPQQGDAVVITEGIFKGLHAIYNEPNGENRAILLLNILNQSVKKIIKNREFQKLTSDNQ